MTNYQNPNVGAACPRVAGSQIESRKRRRPELSYDYEESEIDTGFEIGDSVCLSNLPTKEKRRITNGEVVISGVISGVRCLNKRKQYLVNGKWYLQCQICFVPTPDVIRKRAQETMTGQYRSYIASLTDSE